MKTNVTMSLDVDLALRLVKFALEHDLQKSQIYAEAIEEYMLRYKEKKNDSKKDSRQ